MTQPQIHERQRLHDVVTNSRESKRDLYYVYSLIGVGAITAILFYCLPIGTVGDITVIVLSQIGFFYIGIAYNNIRRRLKKATDEYNEAFGVNRVL